MELTYTIRECVESLREYDNSEEQEFLLDEIERNLKAMEEKHPLRNVDRFKHQNEAIERTWAEVPLRDRETLVMAMNWLFAPYVEKKRKVARKAKTA